MNIICVEHIFVWPDCVRKFCIHLNSHANIFRIYSNVVMFWWPWHSTLADRKSVFNGFLFYVLCLKSLRWPWPLVYLFVALSTKHFTTFVLVPDDLMYRQSTCFSRVCSSLSPPNTLPPLYYQTIQCIDRVHVLVEFVPLSLSTKHFTTFVLVPDDSMYWQSTCFSKVCSSLSLYQKLYHLCISISRFNVLTEYMF